MNRTARIDRKVIANKPLGAALREFAASVVRLDSVDPVTTELVRLRCANHHDCGT